MSLLAATVSFPETTFVPLALGFFGLGTGYLIYGPQELFLFPTRNRAVDVTTGIWGVWMPGFMQFLAGTYIWVGMVWFHSFRAAPLYMAALAFTAYGVHWWAIGLARAFGADPRPNGMMSIAFTIISALGIVVFWNAGDHPVSGLFIGLTCIYVSDFFASTFRRDPVVEPVGAPAGPPGGRPEPMPLAELGERALGFFHLGTGFWLMYLTFAVTLNFTNGFHLLV